MTLPSTLTEAREKLNAKQAEMADIVTSAKTESGEIDFSRVKGAGFEGDTGAKLERFRAMNDELAELAKHAESLHAAQEAAGSVDEYRAKGATPIVPGRAEAPAKTIGELFVNSAAFKSFRPGTDRESVPVDFDLAKDLGGGDMYSGVKTLMTTTAGFGPEAVRTGRVVDFATRPVQVLDLIPNEATDQTAVVYMEETTFTNAAAETAEAGLYPEAALALTERSSPVRKIAVWLPVTDEQLEDAAQIQAYINNRLSFMIRQRLDAQILNGTGVAPNLEGLNNRAGIQAQTWSLAGGQPAFLDAILRARTKVRTVGQAVANAIFINPADIDDIRLMRTSDGAFIFGNPAGPDFERLWGMQVVEADVQPADGPLVGDTTMTGFAMKRNVTVKVTDAHSDFFVNGKQAVRADLRGALQVYRPAAFVKLSTVA